MKKEQYVKTEDQTTKLKEVCGLCGQSAILGFNEPSFVENHTCPMAGKLDPLEHQVAAAMMMSEGCDHFCCGLTEIVCRAKSVAWYLREQGLLGATEGREAK